MKHPWTHGQAERVNRTTVKRFHNADYAPMRKHPMDWRGPPLEEPSARSNSENKNLDRLFYLVTIFTSSVDFFTNV